MASPAASVSGLALKVPPSATFGLPLAWSKTAMRAAGPDTAPTGSPPPMILPSVTKSGRSPNIGETPPKPRRKFTTSSTMSRMPSRAQASCTAAMTAAGIATMPALDACGSSTMAASEGPCRRRIAAQRPASA